MSIIKMITGKKPSVENLINKPVISIPNEWSDVYIGLCIDQYQQGGETISVIRDFISGEEVKVNYRTFIYTEQRMQFVLKADRYDLCSLLYPDEFPEDSFNKPKNMYLLKIPEIINRLRNNGFWDILLEYKQKDNQIK